MSGFSSTPELIFIGRNDTLTDIEMFTRSQITKEKRSRVSEMRYVDGRNKNLATHSPSASK